MKPPLISVVLPFFNAPTLPRSIQSILNQTFKDFELILVDNGSVDRSSSVAKEYAKIDERVILVNQPQRGVVFAANKGITLSRGKYIARMDADDYSFPERLEIQVSSLKEDHRIGVVSGLVEYEGKESNGGFIRYVNWSNSVTLAHEIAINQFVEFPVVNPTLMVKREIFEQYGMYEDGDFPEDYELFLRLLSHGVKFQKVNQTILKWSDSETRLTRTDNRYSTEAFFRIKAKYLTKWLEKNNQLHPKIYIWGGGRLSRKRSNYLLEEGINIIQYIDVKDAENTIHFEQIPSIKECFIVSYVSNWGARAKIKSFLISRGFKEGVHFILAV